MKRAALIFSVLASSLALAAPAQTPLSLRLKLQPDQALNYGVKTQIAQDMMGTDLSQTVDMTMSIKTAKAEKGTQALVQMTNVKLTLPENVPLPFTVEDLTKSIESVKTTIVYSDLGKALETKIEADDMAKMFSALSSGSANVGFLGLEYPEKALNIGDTWSAEINLTEALTAAGATPGPKKALPVAYTLTKVENGVATIKAVIKGTMETQGPGGMSANLDTDTESEYLVDIATGLPTTITTKGTNKIDFGGMTLDQKVSSTITKA
ncbi:MAG TPA: DUF6263 family protein [Fimbriimonas sp.]